MRRIPFSLGFAPVTTSCGHQVLLESDTPLRFTTDKFVAVRL